MLWLCLYFPLLPLQVFTRAETDRTGPALVSEQSRVLCANSGALDAGVKPGQSVATATALIAGLRVIARDGGKEAISLNQLANWCYQFSPMVSLRPPDRLLLEVQGSLRLFNGLAQLQTQINSSLEKMGFTVCQGLGHTPKAAELLARSDTNSPITDIESAAYRRILEQTPLAYLDLPDKQLALLQDMGLTRLGELLALPQHAIGKRFGHEFLRYLQQVNGERPDPQPPISPKPDFRSELFYIEGIPDKQGLLFPIKRLLTEFCEFLRSRQLYCQTFCWHFAELRHPPQLLELNLSQAQSALPAFLEITRIKLDTLPLGSTLHSIVLSATDFVAASPISRSLLEPAQNPRSCPPELLLDKLSARLGRQALQGIGVRQEHIPELACYAAPCCPQQTDRVLPQISMALRPFWLLPQPEPVRQRQQQLFWRGRLTLLRGPERIDSHWWQDPPIQRDYFVARHEQGALYWVFRNVTDRQWFIHGLFY